MKPSVVMLPILAALTLSACIPEPSGPAGAYDGKPVAFPVHFIGAARTGNVIFREEFPNVPLKCDYEFGGKRGQFTTPATVVFEFTNSPKTLAVDCSVNTVVQRGIRRPKVVGKVSASIQTSDTKWLGVRYIGNDLQHYSANTPQLASELRQQLVHSRGVQILPPVIAIVASDR